MIFSILSMVPAEYSGEKSMAPLLRYLNTRVSTGGPNKHNILVLVKRTTKNNVYRDTYS